MQYLLTTGEYTALQKKATDAVKANVDLMNELCMQVAQYKPVPCSWDKTREPAPWGCIYTPCPLCDAGSYEGEPSCDCEYDDATEDDYMSKLAPYCDDCPVQKQCNMQQSYSK